jgi:hypothetical protein
MLSGRHLVAPGASSLLMQKSLTHLEEPPRVPATKDRQPGASLTWSMLPKLGCDSLHLFTESIPFFERKGVMDRETP